MSVWGDNPRYIIGAKRQTELAKKFYNDFRVRIYTDNPENFSDIDAEIVQMTTNLNNGYFWRFLPMFESSENITLVRDADGRITHRESIAAVS